MSFNFANSVVSLAAGKSITINYWLNAGALMGPAMATFYPYLSTCKGLYATGQGVSYSYEKDKYIYHVKIANFGTETQAFQIWGGILP